MTEKVDVPVVQPKIVKTFETDEEGRQITKVYETTETNESIMTKVTTTTKEYVCTLEEKPVHKEKLQSALNGDAQIAPTDNGLSTAEKTPEQEVNLAKLVAAKQFLATEEGAKIAENLLLQNGNLSNGQKKWLKKQGIDPNAFMQEWHKANPEEGRYNAQAASEKLDDMGALANAYLGEDTEEFPQNRQTDRKDGVRNEEERTFLEKMFTKKEKQHVKDSKKYAQNGGSKVNIHSSQTAERKAQFSNDISDDVARAGNEFLEAYEDGYTGKKRQKIQEINEDGNIVKTKVVYRKDGSVKKVVRKSDDEGKLKVREHKDSHITIKGDLQSDNIMREASTTGSYGEERVTTSVETYIIEKCPEEDVPPPPTPTKPVPPTPPKPDPVPTPPAPPAPSKVDEPGGLIADFVNDSNTGGFGSVQGSTVRKQYETYGAEALAKGYCSYTSNNVPEQAKRLWGKHAEFRINSYNAEHIAQSLINDIDSGDKPFINEKALAAMIEVFRNENNEAALSGIKIAISRHNNRVKAMNESERGYDSGTRTVNSFISGRELAISWLMKNKDL